MKLALEGRDVVRETAKDRSERADRWKEYSESHVKVKSDTTDSDSPYASRPLVDGRHTMLEVSMFRHLQFDTLRRAKHATATLLYHLHFPSRSLDAYCSSCSQRLVGLRWHCGTCTNFDACSDCQSHKGCHPHALTPYLVSSAE